MNFKEGRDLAKEMWDELRNTKIEREKIIYDHWLEGFIEDINKCVVEAPVKIGDVVIKNVLGMGVDVVACRNIDIK